ncbi:LLM class flavin-dependent oxidoreductase [Rhodococcus sp. 3Y1]
MVGVPTEPDANWLEPLTVLAFVAGQTKTIRLGTGIVIAALRGGGTGQDGRDTRSALRGRLDLGVGTGWQEREYEAAGMDFGKGDHCSTTLSQCAGPCEFGAGEHRHPSSEVRRRVLCAPSGRWNPDLGVRFALQGRCTTRRNLG